MGITDAEDDLFASLLMQFAAGAVADVFTDETQRLDRVGGRGFGLGRGDQIIFRYDCDGSGNSRHFFSLFWLAVLFLRAGCRRLTAVKIIDAQLVVEADPFGQGAF